MTQSEPVVVVAELVARIANIPAPAPEDDMYVAGLASTDALELLVELEDAFGISIPDDRFIEARTVGQLAGVVTDLRASAA
jgi:acyl carrier protein